MATGQLGWGKFKQPRLPLAGIPVFLYHGYSLPQKLRSLCTKENSGSVGRITRRIEFNRPAVRISRELGLPLLGISNSHLASQFGMTYSLFDSESMVASFLGAIRKGRVKVVIRPLTFRQLAGIAIQPACVTYGEQARRAWCHSILRPVRYASRCSAKWSRVELDILGFSGFPGITMDSGGHFDLTWPRHGAEPQNWG